MQFYTVFEKSYDFWNILHTEFDSQIIAYFTALSMVNVSLGKNT